jgi:hypothetical protein
MPDEVHAQETGDRQPLPVWAIVAAVLAIALVAVGIAWWISAGAAAERLAETERRLDALEASASAASAADSATPPADEMPEPTAKPPTVTAPSYVRYAYVMAVSGSADTYSLSLDFFDILTEGDAVQYASDHGMTPPANGILYVNEDPSVTSVPLAKNAVILYATGGVEALSMVPATAQELKEWAAGTPDALPGSMTNMWKVTVDEGVATRVEMIAVAD